MCYWNFQVYFGALGFVYFTYLIRYNFILDKLLKNKLMKISSFRHKLPIFSRYMARAWCEWWIVQEGMESCYGWALVCV